MNALVYGNLPDDIMARITARHETMGHPHDRPLDRDDLLAAVTDKHGLLCMITDTIDAQLLDVAPQLKMIANFGVGYNNIDVEAATARGIMVSNAPGVLTDATADLTMALILAAGRRVAEADRHTRAGKFRSGLTALPNVVLLPHVGSATLETRRRMADLAVDNLLAGLDGRLPPNCINAQQLGIGSST
jgi:lactate dehydrogenase-like 2-hydroxyacid dehydrogenase